MVRRIRRLFLEALRGGWRERARMGGAQLSGPEMKNVVVMALGAVEQGLAHRLDPHPGEWIGLQRRHVLLNPVRGRRGHLGSSRRSSCPIEVDDFRAAETGPRHVGRRGGDRGAHLVQRPVIAGHKRRPKVRIGLVIGHDAAGRHHTVETRGINDVARRDLSEIIARRSDDKDSGFVDGVDRLGPDLRGKPAHAHGHDMDRSFRLGRQQVRVIERLTYGAVVEQLHLIGDAYGDDFGKRRSAEDASAERRRGENTERACPVSAVVDQILRTVGGVVGKIAVDEIFPQVGSQKFRPADMIGVRIEAGVEMRDAYARSLRVREIDAVEIRSVVGAMPERRFVQARRPRKSLVLPFRGAAVGAERESGFGVALDHPLLGKIRLDETRRWGAGDTEALVEKRMAQIPWRYVGVLGVD